MPLHEPVGESFLRDDRQSTAACSKRTTIYRYPPGHKQSLDENICQTELCAQRRRKRISSDFIYPLCVVAENLALAISPIYVSEVCGPESGPCCVVCRCTPSPARPTWFTHWFV